MAETPTGSPRETVESVAVLTQVGGIRLVAVGVVEIVTAPTIRGRARQVPRAL
ncbi:hypothetical protein M2271_007623 [Streptomyces sp. LBL]|nr:hypothetical protein [Streptomyces sp. LBL]